MKGEICLNEKFGCESCEVGDNYGLFYVNECDDGILGTEYKIKAYPQYQSVQPGMECLMNPKPIFDNYNYKGSNRLKGKVAIITGGDSGIGRAVAVYFAKEGAMVVIVYYNEHEDAEYTKKYIENLGGCVELLSGDLKDPSFAKFVVDSTLERYGKIDILVNNAGVQYPQKSLLDITEEQFDFTLKTNLYSIFYLTKEVLPYLKEGSSIINTSSITTYYGEPELIDYAASKGAIVGFTKALATNLARKNIRVNAVAPGTFWTPLQPSSWSSDKIPTFGSKSDLKRAGEPYEIASTYVYLASPDSSYTTGQVIHVNGGEYKA